MEFQANYLSVSASGDYYQVSIAEKDDDSELDGAYLLIQRQFEMPEEDDVYIETHDEEFIGHFCVRRIEFTPDNIFVELDRPNNNYIKVALNLTLEKFEYALPILKIISGGEIDPLAE